ncbi:hypothetical protein AGMMS50262_05340 [Bacteroidia bacterium]|nr:hypothetical protein AGMMS50262_05340 [Bacteroidia bacterium]
MSKKKLGIFGWFFLGFIALSQAQTEDKPFISPAVVTDYVQKFNQKDNELYKQFIPNNEAGDFLAQRIPRFECPDKELEEIFYFRFWTYRKHIKQTPDGYVITEFLPAVQWSEKYNAIPCAAMFHFNEGRWLNSPEFLNSYAYFWLRGGVGLRSYSFPIAHTLYNYYLTTGNDSLILDLLPDLIANYEAWVKERRDANGLFWQIGNSDGMEMSVAASLLNTDEHYRATINSYLFAEAHAISLIARHAGKPEIAERFHKEAEYIRRLLYTKLWDDKTGFYKVAPRVKNPETPLTLVDVHELHGYTPWFAEALIPPKKQTIAWKQLFDTQGFYAPFGPTTAEQRHPGFKIAYEGHECQWNGPSWPYATSITLIGLANLLNNQKQNIVGKNEYFDLLQIYAHSQHLTKEDGTVVPWIDENLNPFTGDWISRTRLKTWQNGTWSAEKGGVERGKDYNHSEFCDLVITGLAGIRPQEGKKLTVNPLIPADKWDYFCLDNLHYQGHQLVVVYDKYGTKYNRGKGLMVFVDGILQAKSNKIQKLTVSLFS